jgi:hypothetical protein
MRQYGPNALRERPPPQFNGALHLAVILGVGLRLLTALLPGLRALLGLDPLTLDLLTLVSAAVLMTRGAAEAYSRLALSYHRIREEAA